MAVSVALTNGLWKAENDGYGKEQVSAKGSSRPADLSDFADVGNSSLLMLRGDFELIILFIAMPRFAVLLWYRFPLSGDRAFMQGVNPLRTDHLTT